MAHRVPFWCFRVACYLVARAPNSIRVWLANARVWISNRACDHARVRSNPSAEWRDYASRRALGHGGFLHLHRALVQAATQTNLASSRGTNWAEGRSMDYEIIPEEVKSKFDAGESFTLLDVREPWEFETARIEGGMLMPMGEVPSRAHQELDPEDHVVVVCHHGVRSMNVTA